MDALKTVEFVKNQTNIKAVERTGGQKQAAGTLSKEDKEELPELCFESDAEVDTMLYGRTSTFLEDVKASLKLKELKNKVMEERGILMFVRAMGVVHFEIYGGMVRELTIHHVSGLRQNLLSLSLLEEVTYYEFSGEGCTHVGDLEVSPWLRPSLACSAGMVDSSYACPSWVASNGGSTLGLPNCGIESIVCLGKGKHERFYMGCAVENYTVRKTLVQQSCGMECWSLVLSMGRVQWLSELLVVGWVSLVDITIVFWFKHVVFVDMGHKQVAFGKEQSKNGARCDMVIWQGEFRLRLKLGSFSWSMVTSWWMAGIEEFLSRRDWLKKMQAKVEICWVFCLDS
ncbi:Uncharacterized protein TCM_004270 [Theobroma cacao]|uniref:Uncharacterized protein n=1 Tax=Theobroma cacao TaxID=3641 RepID=A0A061DPL4_THECC|nr:Uncharacterized protein TCM_004270 [Theobroma cacao]